MPCPNVLVPYQENLHKAARSLLYMHDVVRVVYIRCNMHLVMTKLNPLCMYHALC